MTHSPLTNLICIKPPVLSGDIVKLKPKDICLQFVGKWSFDTGGLLGYIHQTRSINFVDPQNSLQYTEDVR